MTVVCWILGILVLLVVLLCLTRVGVLVTSRGALTVDAKIACFRLRVYPGKDKKGEEKPKVKKEPKKTARPKFTLADIKDAVRTLWPPLKRALNRTRKGIRISPMDVSVTLGGAKDPAAAAELYGYVHAGMWTAMPKLEQLLVIPDPHIHIGLDFDAETTIFEGEIGVSARIGTLLLAVLGVGIPAVRWFLRFQKKQTQQTTAPQPTA